MFQLIQKIVLPVLYLRARKHKEVLLSALKNQVDIENPHTLLNFYLKSVGFYLDQSIFEKIDPTDYLEIYDRYGVQLFRTYNIFKYTTYSFEELFTKRVDELYERNPFYTRLIYKAAYKIFDQKTQLETQFCPDHIVTEKKTNGSAVHIGYKFMCPVYESDLGEIVGVLVCEKIRLPTFSEVEHFRQSDLV